MRSSPSIVPTDRLDRDIYLVLEDFGARAGCAWRETDEQDTDRETALRDIISGQYSYPVRIVAFNATRSRAGPATPPRTSRIRWRTGPDARGLTFHPRCRRSSRPIPRVHTACNSRCRCVTSPASAHG